MWSPFLAGDQNVNPNGLLFKFLLAVSSASLVPRVNGDEFSTGAMIDQKKSIQFGEQFNSKEIEHNDHKGRCPFIMQQPER